MEPIQTVLNKIEDLIRDLSAEIVHQEGTGEYWAFRHEIDDEVYAKGGCVVSSSREDWETPMYWVTGKPRIAHPNTEKRYAARQALEQIMGSTESCCVRYMAWRALGIDEQTFVSRMQRSLTDATREDIENLYNALSTYPRIRLEDETVRRETGKVLGYSEGFILGDEFGRRYNNINMLAEYLHYDISKLGKIYREGSNPTVRKAAKRKLNQIMLYAVQSGRLSDREDVRRAGEELGYSRLRIWWTLFLDKPGTGSV